MSIAKKIAHKARGGETRRQGDCRSRYRRRRLQAEGRGGQAKGNIKQAGAKIKDSFKH
ncbi:CsbD family protein [Streptomyces sp. NPDC006208]|uniref:CsbD family protein n=1 Tax=Streptomyces sp. NPDC006208 TaxID=3156734 RepID=UPI0033A06C7F